MTISAKKQMPRWLEDARRVVHVFETTGGRNPNAVHFPPWMTKDAIELVRQVLDSETSAREDRLVETARQIFIRTAQPGRDAPSHAAAAFREAEAFEEMRDAWFARPDTEKKT